MYTTFVTSWFADYWSFLEPAINETRDAFGLAPAHDWPGVFAGHDRLLAVVPQALDAPVTDAPDSLRHFGFFVPHAAQHLRRPTSLPARRRPCSSG